MGSRNDPSIAVIRDTRTCCDGIDEEVLVITGDVPHRETKQVVVSDELPLGGERGRVVVGNHQLSGLIVSKWSLTAAVESILDAIGSSPVTVKDSFADHGSESDDVHSGLWGTALIDGAGERRLGERWVVSNVSRAVYGVGGGDIVGVAVSGNSEQDLVRGDTGGRPGLDSLDRGANLNLGARVIQRSVGTNTGVSSPLAVDIVVHDGDMIENGGEIGHIGHRLAIRTNEGSRGNCSRKVKVLSCRILAQILEECKEICSVGRGHLVTTNSSRRGIFPVEVDSIKTVFANHSKDSLDKRGTVLRGDRRREVSGTSPSTDGEDSQRVMVVGLLDEGGDVRGTRIF